LKVNGSTKARDLQRTDCGGRPPSLHCVSCLIHSIYVSSVNPHHHRVWGCAKVQSVLGSVTCHQSLSMQGTTSEVQGHSLLSYTRRLCALWNVVEHPRHSSHSERFTPPHYSDNHVMTKKLLLHWCCRIFPASQNLYSLRFKI
jgi:hypothetical protein